MLSSVANRKPPRVLTYSELWPERARRDPARASDVWVYVPRGSRPIRMRIGPAGPESEAEARAVIAELTGQVIDERLGRAMRWDLLCDRFVDAGWRSLDLAPSTARVYRQHAAVFREAFQGRRVDQISVSDVAYWWEARIAQGGSAETARRYLSSLGTLFRYAVVLGCDVESPVPRFLTRLDGNRGTKARRAKQTSTATPLTVPELRALDRAFRECGDPDAYTAFLLMLDHGMRRGEVFALRRSSVWAGQSPDDLRRWVVVRENRPNGLPPESPKSGLDRRVPLSRSLRAHILAHYTVGWPPDRPLLSRWYEAAQRRARKTAAPDGSEWFTDTLFPRMLRRAGITRDYTPKALRDTFASHLLSAGFPQVQIMRWIGHQPGSVAMFRRRYAMWLGETDDDAWSYRPPQQLAPGEVPTDLFSGLCERPGARLAAVRDPESR